jgi:hypothetical protein
MNIFTRNDGAKLKLMLENSFPNKTTEEMVLFETYLSGNMEQNLDGSIKTFKFEHYPTFMFTMRDDYPDGKIVFVDILDDPIDCEKINKSFLRFKL